MCLYVCTISFPIVLFFQFRFACVTLMIVLAINHSDQSSIRSQSAEHQSIVKEHSPINIIRIKPVALESSKNNFDHQENRRKQKSSTETGLSESNGSASSVIVIKPVLSPISEYPAKKNSKKFWKKMMRRPKFLHDVKKGDNMSVSRVARVHLAPGAYPVFYGLAKTNGNFNKIKSITHSTNY